jgi:hypothetical protein
VCDGCVSVVSDRPSHGPCACGLGGMLPSVVRRFVPTHPCVCYASCWAQIESGAPSESAWCDSKARCLDPFSATYVPRCVRGCRDVRVGISACARAEPGCTAAVHALALMCSWLGIASPLSSPRSAACVSWCPPPPSLQLGVTVAQRSFAVVVTLLLVFVAATTYLRCTPQYEHASSVAAFSAAIIMLSSSYDGTAEVLGAWPFAAVSVVARGAMSIQALC